jgi:hypothetical protein
VVTLAVELHAGGESVRQAAVADAAMIPSRPRRARHRIEEARGYQLDGQPEVALAALGKAFEAAPETMCYNGLCAPRKRSPRARPSGAGPANSP